MKVKTRFMVLLLLLSTLAVLGGTPTARAGSVGCSSGTHLVCGFVLDGGPWICECR